MPGLKNVPNIRLSKTTLCHKNHLNLSLIYFHLRITLLKFLIKFGLSEKPTKFEKNLPYGFDKSADLLSKRQNHKADFFKLCVLFKKSEL